MIRHFLLAAGLIGAAALPAAAQSISLTLRDGRITLITQNATPAAILAEWARQGQVRVVDGERLPGAPLTLRLENVSEREALDIVLRGAAGYVAAPRAQQVSTLSRFDRVMVMPTSPGAATAAANGPPARPAASAIVAATPVQVEEPAEAAPQQAAVQEDVQPVVAAPEQPSSSTNFDYANPQRYFAARQAEQQAAEAAAAGAAGAQQAQPAAGSSPNSIFGATRSTPGILPTPQPPANGQPGQATQGGAGNVPVNPYGLPANQQPGSATAPPMEPDRAKYINPYSPTPPRP